jgi:hypothetical protein
VKLITDSFRSRSVSGDLNAQNTFVLSLLSLHLSLFERTTEEEEEEEELIQVSEDILN